MKKRKKYIIVCPYCGKELCKSGFKSSFNDMEIRCSRCGANLKIEITNGMIIFHPDKNISMVAENSVEYKEKEKI